MTKSQVEGQTQGRTTQGQRYKKTELCNQVKIYEKEQNINEPETSKLQVFSTRS
jgi:hypothetical protein